MTEYRKTASAFKPDGVVAGSGEGHFLRKRRRSSNNTSDVSKLPPAIQVWAEEEDESSGDSVKTETTGRGGGSSDDDEDEDLQLTPKAVSGPMFLMPEVRNIQVQAPRAVENLEKAINNGSTSYLQVPFSVPRRRHSWICG